mmetsp:Transcript_72343/g.115346  ORF Transcript_72343/g.115346 Transcript_72343/m.115346 type:complete len:146 (+) Transcript_72343:171-608(+)|eukprot:CAMPEP_0197034266 /NCGR_PEP_ID=MMETSP1384-20130603/12431_1 /TAXON_ID=29189 /ORGANISM="Ammonia sp." /LENGTH=145 /DNA_ID=CAMNT_0042464171 /DNA_START=138 /DNA_END=575 /DNA_ORIENTATION=-
MADEAEKDTEVDAEAKAEESEEEEQEKKPTYPKGKYWDEEMMAKFQDEMEDEVMELIKDIDSYAEQQDEISQIVSKILDISQDKLEKSNMANYKYWSNCLIFDKRTVYRKHMKFFWEKSFDKMISIKVNSERLHVLLLAYCVYYG